MWHGQADPGLQAPQQIPGFQACTLAQGWRFDLATEPDKWLVFWIHWNYIPVLTY